LVALCYQGVLYDRLGPCGLAELYDLMVLYDQEVLSNGDQADGHGDQVVVLCDLVGAHGDQVVVLDDQVEVLCDLVEEGLCNQEEDPWEVSSHAYPCEEEGHHAEVQLVLEEDGLEEPVGNHMVAEWWQAGSV